MKTNFDVFGKLSKRELVLARTIEILAESIAKEVSLTDYADIKQEEIRLALKQAKREVLCDQ